MTCTCVKMPSNMHLATYAATTSSNVLCCGTVGCWNIYPRRSSTRSPKTERGVMTAAVETYPAALECAHPSLQGDREMVLAAMRSGGLGYRALIHAPSHLRQDVVVLAGAV